MKDTRNFEDKVIYQVYPKSFRDSNGDGLGDIRGITEKLDYLQYLGVDYIWSTPFFVSPQNDNGYDVADYYKIDPAYGTMEDLEELIREADKRGIGLMLDMVFNHTSTEHEWFQKALAGDVYYKDFYIFRDGKDGNPPTNWESKFGGTAWEYVPLWNQYYLRLFDKTQADLNWENPAVRRELVKVLKFWIEKGIRGFRFDVINLVSKPERYEDDLEGDGRRFYTDGPKMHTYLKELCRDSGITEKGLLTVGEMSSTSLECCVGYTNPKEQELSMSFSFHHLKVDYKDQKKWELQPFDFQALKEILNRWQTGMEEADGWNALFWNNHDQPRAVSRFCKEKKYQEKAAKMLASCIHLLRGTPYIYQGEEIGMTNAGFQDISEYRDVESLNYFEILKSQGRKEEEIYQILGERSRDNGRTPMQWDDSAGAGFGSTEPWIQVNKNYREINVQDQIERKDSIWQYYHRLIRLRKEEKVIASGSYHPLLEKHPAIFAFERRTEDASLIALHNFYPEETEADLSGFDLEGYVCLLDNYGERACEKTLRLRPYESAAFIKKF